jgi:hypothetical protein
MRYLIALLIIASLTTLAIAEPGAIKVGALVDVVEKSQTHDVSLVEFLTVKNGDDRVVSLNLGGSYASESLGVAALADANGVLRLVSRYIPFGIKFDALDFEAGIYVSRQFVLERWNFELCATLFSHKF